MGNAVKITYTITLKYPIPEWIAAKISRYFKESMSKYHNGSLLFGDSSWDPIKCEEIPRIERNKMIFSFYVNEKTSRYICNTDGLITMLNLQSEEYMINMSTDERIKMHDDIRCGRDICLIFSNFGIDFKMIKGKIFLSFLNGLGVSFPIYEENARTFLRVLKMECISEPSEKDYNLDPLHPDINFDQIGNDIDGYDLLEELGEIIRELEEEEWFDSPPNS